RKPERPGRAPAGAQCHCGAVVRASSLPPQPPHGRCLVELRFRAVCESITEGLTSRLMPAFDQDVRFTRSADGTRLAYAVHGSGFPLVRAAHWLTNIDRDWQTPMWRPWFNALGARYRFHRYDSRGCGLSDRESTDSSLDKLVEDLEAVVDAAKLERF